MSGKQTQIPDYFFWMNHDSVHIGSHNCQSFLFCIASLIIFYETDSNRDIQYKMLIHILLKLAIKHRSDKTHNTIY